MVIFGFANVTRMKVMKEESIEMAVRCHMGGGLPLDEWNDGTAV